MPAPVMVEKRSGVETWLPLMEGSRCERLLSAAKEGGEGGGALLARAFSDAETFRVLTTSKDRKNCAADRG